MSVSPPKAITRVVDDLPPVPEAVLREALGNSHDASLHARLARDTQALHVVEARPGPRAGQALRHPGPVLRVAAWNAERCKFLPEAMALLRGTASDVILLSEMDIGMARSGNRHTVRDLATGLGCGYAFGTEFVETGLGTPSEQEAMRGSANRRALHGNAILSALALSDPAIVPLEEGGSWFAHPDQNPRIGGRNALAASVRLGGIDVLVASVHLESLPGPERRLQQVERLLAYVAHRQPAGPAVLGGDFNTSGLPRQGREPPGTDWFTAPGAYEPLFDALREAGFTWASANTPEPTRRTLPSGRPQPPFTRMDWFFVRGLRASRPRTIAAVGERDQALSDHEVIALDLELP